MNRISAQTKQLIINILLGALGIYLAFLLITTIKRNFELQHQINQIQDANKELVRSNLELQYQIEYFQTELYNDKAARAKLGLQAPGEKVLILPKQPEQQQLAETKKPQRSNFAQWIDFLRGISQ